MKILIVATREANKLSGREATPLVIVVSIMIVVVSIVVASSKHRNIYTNIATREGNKLTPPHEVTSCRLVHR